MEPIVQPYNMFAQQKMAGYPNSEDKHKNPYADRAAAQEAVNRDASIGYGGAPGIDKAGVRETKTTPVVTKTTPQTFTPLDTRSSTAGMDYLNSLYTDPNEEERLRKASVMNQRILAIGDAVRHIGNIANTVGYAPSQKFNDPVALEQARYEKGKALRDKANLTYLTYQQQKAAQDAALRKWEQQYGLQAANAASQNAYRQVQTKLAAERIKLQRDLAEARKASDAARVKKIEADIKRIDELLPGEKKLQNARINQANASAESSRASADLNKEKKEHPEKFRSRGGSVGGYTTIRKRNVKNPLTGKYEVVTDTITRTPSHPRSEVDEGYDGDDMDLGLEEEENGIDLGLE